MKNKNLSFNINLSLFIFLTFFLSCSDTGSIKKDNSDSFFTIPFAEIVKSKGDVKTSEFASKMEIIQLENSPDALLGTFENIEFTKDYIFINCWNQPILQFSRNGTLVRQIGAIGKGPEEYSMCLKMSVDETNERVYIHTVQFNIMVFNFDGEYIKTIQFPALENFMNFWSWSRDSFFVSYFEPVSGNETNVFIEHNQQGDTLQSIPNYIFYASSERADPFNLSPFADQNKFYRFKRKLHLKGCYNDTVYAYNEENNIVPKYFIDLGKHKLPSDLIYERKWTRPIPDNLSWTGVHETANYIFIPYGYHYDVNKPEMEKKEKGYVLYNKKTREGLAISESKMGGFIDDLTGGPEFRPIITNDSTAIMLVSALDMKLHLSSDKFKNQTVKYPEEKEKLIQLNRTLKESDNHFLMVARLKD